MTHAELIESLNLTIRLMLERSLTESDIYGRLLAAGANEETAGHLTVFVPAIMTRLMLREIHFPEEYVEMVADGTSISRKLSEDQLYRLIETELIKMVEKGMSPDGIITIAGRAAEFNAVNDLMIKQPGGKLKDIKLTPLVVSFENLKG